VGTSLAYLPINGANSRYIDVSIICQLDYRKWNTEIVLALLMLNDKMWQGACSSLSFAYKGSQYCDSI
jgi:hypothetical protein